MKLGELLWMPSEERVESTNVKRFIEFVNEKRDMLISNYNKLWQRSMDNIG